MRLIKTLVLFLWIISLLVGCFNYKKTTSTSINSASIARGFYQDMIVNKDMTKFNKYMGKIYTQHATGYPEGAQALKEELQANAKSNNKITILRVVGEANYAALHSLWTIGAKKILYVDIWRIHNNKLVEHWDQFQYVAMSSLNKNTMYNGSDTDINANQNIKRNRQRAIAVLKVFDNLTDLSPVEKYVSTNYTEHNPKIKDGKTAFLEFLKTRRANSSTYKTTIAKTIAMGDMVVIHSKVIDTTITNDLGVGAIDIFRFDEKGQITEHWDVLETITGKSLNTNNPFFYP